MTGRENNYTNQEVEEESGWTEQEGRGTERVGGERDYSR